MPTRTPNSNSKGKKEPLLTITGGLLILTGIVLNEWTLASLTSDGKIDSRGQLLLIRLFDLSTILLGAALIIFRKSQWLLKLLASLAVLLLTVFVLDTLLYFSAPLLPESLVLAMSPNAQLRYIRSDPPNNPWVYDDYIRYAKPGATVELFGIQVQADSLGYRNPPGYLAQRSGIDVVLVGDSFIWGTEETTIADHLREVVAPMSVYSVGMAGDGISQWRYHYQRFVQGSNTSPRIVALNFYSGNDITDTRLFLGLQSRRDPINAAEYYAYLNYQFLVPSPGRTLPLPKPPELLFLANYTFDIFQNRNLQSQESQPSLQIAGQPVLACAHHREPYPEQFGPDIFAEIQRTVQTIQTLTPDAKILLSYIPTSGGLYGDLMTACPDYANDIPRQQAASQILAQYADQLGIYYFDATPQLRQYAKTSVVWSQIDHFSPLGYRLYAELLAEAIQSLSEGQE